MSGCSKEVVKIALEEANFTTKEEMCTVDDKMMDKITFKKDISTLENICTVLIKEEDTTLEKDNIKEEIASVEDMCTVFMKEEDVKTESTEIKGKLFFRFIYLENVKYPFKEFVYLLEILLISNLVSLLSLTNRSL